MPTGGSWSSGEGGISGVKPSVPGPQPPASEPPDIAYSMFPIENHELVHTRWEEDVIWDSEASSISAALWYALLYTYVHECGASI